jgi:DMSO/TMAO reductase YedYZ molybdopterin-dependent catalytic subunit
MPTAFSEADWRRPYRQVRRLSLPDNYSTSIDMPTAVHPQTQLTFKFGSNILPVKYWHPLKLRVPTKLGYKNPKHITEIVVSNDLPSGFWENYGYNWFSGL